MGHRLHTRIFFPVLLILLLFPTAVWISFSVLSGWYLKNRTERNVGLYAKQVMETASDVFSDLSAETSEEEEKENIKGLIPKLKLQRQNGDQEASLLIISSRFQLVYPDDDLAATSVRQLYESCEQMLQEGTLAKNQFSEIRTADRDYIVRLLELRSPKKIRAKYLICYEPVPDIRPLMSQAGTLLIVITGLFLLIAAVLVWAVSGSIAHPLEALSRQTALIGNGNYDQIPEHYSIAELENLKNSVNRMAGNLKRSEKRTLYFFQNASHDLRTPLMSICGYAQGIQCGVITDTKKAAGIILKESSRMTGLVEDILMLSRMDSRVFELDMVSVPLKPFLEEQTKIMSGRTDGTKLEMEENSPDVFAEADVQLLTRIVQNILANCMRYAESRVLIRTVSENDSAEVCVEDDGPGISAKDLPHVFERFYKGDGGKFGIGLSVARSGMEYMGGTVSVENRVLPAHGTIWHLVLPAEKKEDSV